MSAEGLFFASVAAAAATSLVVALAASYYYRRSSTRAAQAYVYYRNGKRVVKHGLNGEVIRIGRHPDCEIRLKDASVSRFHAQISDNKNGTFVIRDLDSKNGVRIFFRRVSSSILADGDILYVGNVGLRFIRYPANYTTVPDTVMLETRGPNRMLKRQRRSERFNSWKPVRFYTDGMGWMSGVARDISEEGMFIETDKRPQKRMPMDIVLQRDADGRWFKLTGEVVRSDQDGIAVIFTDVDRATRKDLVSLTDASEPQEPVAAMHRA